MKILVLTPIWKRPKLTEKFLNAFLKLNPKGIELRLFCILSQEDWHFWENWTNIVNKKILFGIFPNKPLGRKKTLGLKEATKKFNYDYIMELGSDDFLNPEIFKLYRPYIDKGKKFIGLLNPYIYDIDKNRCIWVKEYAGENMSYGAGRMIHRSIIEYFGCNLWNDYNDSLDTMSRKKILKHFPDSEVVIDNKETPYTLGIKTKTHICPFEFMEKHLITKDVDFNIIKKHFGYEN